MDLQTTSDVVTLPLSNFTCFGPYLDSKNH